MRAKFLDFDAATLAGWREHPVTGAFLEWVGLEADRCNYYCSALLRAGRDAEARATAGKAEAMEETLRICTRAPERAEEATEAFVDPAYRFNRDLAPRYEEGTSDVGTD